MTGNVYFIAAPTACMTKIGFTRHAVEHRLRALRAGSPVHLEVMAWAAGGREYERALHEMFAEDWSHGEWFRSSAALVAFRTAVGLGGDLTIMIDPSRYPRGIFVAHMLAESRRT